VNAHFGAPSHLSPGNVEKLKIIREAVDSHLSADVQKY